MPGIDFPVMMISVAGGVETKYYYFHDALGSVVALLNNAGSVVEAYSYDPFGKPTIMSADYQQRATSNYGNKFLFTGREYDSETGLYYYRARHYKPDIGRFLQPDPLGVS